MGPGGCHASDYHLNSLGWPQAASLPYSAGCQTAQLVVLHEFFGLNDHIRSVADRFAALGFGAIVPGLSDRAEPGAEFGYDPEGIAAGHALRAKIPFEKSLLDAQAAIDFVKPHGKVGVVGYCWGGSLAFFAA